MIILIQLAKWFWALFPTLIGIMSPSASYNKQNNLDLQQSQLVDNWDLSIAKPSPNENEPLNFTYHNATDISLTNGISKFTANDIYGRLVYYFDGNIDDNIYVFCNYKTDSINVKLTIPGIPVTNLHSGNNNFEYISSVYTLATSRQLQISDTRSSGWTSIEVDYIGAINLTATFGDNIPDKQVLDDFILSGERFLFTDDTTSDNWFNSGFTSESRDILDILGYFFWLAIPVIAIYWVFRLLLRII